MISGGKTDSASRAESDTGIEKTESRSGARGTASIDISLCSQHANGNYICQAKALSAFSSTVRHMEGGNCSVSYDSENGFSFSGRSKTAQLAAGEMAVSLHPSGSLSGVARQTAQNLTISVDEGGTVRSVMLLDSDYSRDLCMDL